MHLSAESFNVSAYSVVVISYSFPLCLCSRRFPYQVGRRGGRGATNVIYVLYHSACPALCSGRYAVILGDHQGLAVPPLKSGSSFILIG